jgi:hypothetical protein
MSSVTCAGSARRWVLSLTLCAGWCLTAALGTESAAAQTDLDAFMRQVVAARDDNWKKLQQYVLDEREQLEVRGPARLPLWGERREYTWFIRDGFFVRSPLKVNGVTIGEADRRTFEADYLALQQRRDRRARLDPARGTGPGRIAADNAGQGGQAPVNAAADEAPRDANDLDGLIRQTREPQFISSAYFLRFKFEEGKYALVGRETLDGREALKIEYYPAKMFTGTNRRRTGKPATATDRARDAEFRRLMNKVALVTLWVEPNAHQILKYTFDNVGFDFLPSQWLIHVSDVTATMTVSQPFPDVWLPSSLAVNVAMTLAFGQLDLRYDVDYHDYRRPEVTSKVGVK